MDVILVNFNVNHNVLIVLVGYVKVVILQLDIILIRLLIDVKHNVVI